MLNGISMVDKILEFIRDYYWNWSEPTSIIIIALLFLIFVLGIYILFRKITSTSSREQRSVHVQSESEISRSSSSKMTLRDYEDLEGEGESGQSRSSSSSSTRNTSNREGNRRALVGLPDQSSLPPHALNTSCSSSRIISQIPKANLSTASTSQVKLRKHVREVMCQACRGKGNVMFECSVCKNYYCMDCASDFNKKCMHCNSDLSVISNAEQSRKISTARSTGRNNCFVCKNKFDLGFKCPKCDKYYCQTCGIESDENCLNCSSLLEGLRR